MGYKIISKPNTDGVSSSFPYGKIRDEVSPGDGTPVNTLVYGDFHQFFARLAALAGITLNDLPDNLTNGFQFVDALQNLIALAAPANASGSWLDAGTDIAIIPNSGTVSVDAADVKYNKYKVIGRTLFWKICVNNFTITGSPTELSFKLPAALVTASLGFAGSASFAMTSPQGVYNKGSLLFLTYPTSSSGPDPVDVLAKLSGGVPFTNGVNNQFLDIAIMAEIAPF